MITLRRWVEGWGGSFLVSVAATGMSLFLFGLLTDEMWLRVIVKAIPVWAFAVWVYAYRSDSIGKLVTAGLLCSGVGDILLEVSFTGSFVLGMAAFLCGHVLYTFTFVKLAPQRGLVNTIPFIAWGVCIGWLVWGGLGELKIPVVIYMSVIITMMWRSSVLMGELRGLPWRGLIMLGALSYGLSDSLIAINKFHHALDGVRVPIILTYWLGQGVISWVTVKLIDDLDVV